MDNLKGEKGGGSKMEKRIYTVQEVANILQVSVFTVQELLREGKLDGFKVRSRWRIPEESLEDFTRISNYVGRPEDQWTDE